MLSPTIRLLRHSLSRPNTNCERLNKCKLRSGIFVLYCVLGCVIMYCVVFVKGSFSATCSTQMTAASQQAVFPALPIVLLFILATSFPWRLNTILFFVIYNYTFAKWRFEKGSTQPTHFENACFVFLRRVSTFKDFNVTILTTHWNYNHRLNILNIK